MGIEQPKNTGDTEETKVDSNPPKDEARRKELGGRGGVDPTRYGDWEKAGRCIDF